MAKDHKEPQYDVVAIRFKRGHSGFARWQKLLAKKDRDGSDLGKELIEKACDEAGV